MYEELGSVRKAVALSPQEALDSAATLLVQQGYEIAQRTETSVGGVRRKQEGMFGHSLLNLTVAVRPLPQGGIEIKLRGNDHEGVRERQSEWSRWSEGLPKVGQRRQVHSPEGQGVASSETPQVSSKTLTSELRESTGIGRAPSRIDRNRGQDTDVAGEQVARAQTREGHEGTPPTSDDSSRWASVDSWNKEPPVAASKQGHELTPKDSASGVDANQSASDRELRAESTSEEIPRDVASDRQAQEEAPVTQSNMEKQTVRVGLQDGNIGETVSFTANLLGTAQVNGGKDGGGMDYTFYRLPDGNFRVLVEYEDMAMLVPSDMEEAFHRGQRNNYSYGRMTLEEMKAHSYQFGQVYDQLMENHPETVRNRVRDID